MLAILNGLDHEYDTVVNLITYQMDDINLDKLQYLLLMHEQRLASKNLVDSSFVSFDSTINANDATYGSRFGNDSINNNRRGTRGGNMSHGGGYMNRGD